jgi:16S rRNA (guanine527-N7)-methyltransferase
MSEELQQIAVHLQELLAETGLSPLAEGTAQKFAEYLALFERWNKKTNLSAVRDREGILRRHFVESIACAQALPEGIATLLDFGSGGGFPGIPVALCRPETSVTLAESQGKKAAFLHEAVRVLGINAKVHAQRAELLSERFDCVTLRAVDRMEKAVAAAALLVTPGGFLALLTTEQELPGLQAAAVGDFVWDQKFSLPGSDARELVLGRRSV